jgi:hypothetical protein
MLLVVPNGKVKLLNALPFAPADLRRDSLEQAWEAYREAWRSDEVRDFVAACRQIRRSSGMRTKRGIGPRSNCRSTAAASPSTRDFVYIHKKEHVMRKTLVLLAALACSARFPPPLKSPT